MGFAQAPWPQEERGKSVPEPPGMSANGKHENEEKKG